MVLLPGQVLPPCVLNLRWWGNLLVGWSTNTVSLTGGLQRGLDGIHDGDPRLLAAQRWTGTGRGGPLQPSRPAETGAAAGRAERGGGAAAAAHCQAGPAEQ